jgi:hypothetical protein
MPAALSKASLLGKADEVLMWWLDSTRGVLAQSRVVLFGSLHPVDDYKVLGTKPFWHTLGDLRGGLAEGTSSVKG